LDTVFEIRGKTALVTGAAKRLGRAAALALAAEGAHVAIHYRLSADEAEETACAVRACGVKAWTFAADLADPAAVEDLAVRVLDIAGSLDILINNASTFLEDRLTDVTPEDMARSLQLHAMAPLVLSRRFAAQGREGCIVNLLDARVADYDRDHVSYHLGKRALFSLTRMMAAEFAPRVRVNAVAPGLILPPEGKDETYLEQLASTNPLQRYGSPEMVADAVVYLVKACFVTGQVIYVDGGRHLRGNMYG
jgi:NAD(P)-dependent dehydrogenase (short-subunit alcohol dehydrogenase family)